MKIMNVLDGVISGILTLKKFIEKE